MRYWVTPRGKPKSISVPRIPAGEVPSVALVTLRRQNRLVAEVKVKEEARWRCNTMTTTTSLGNMSCMTEDNEY
jgi:hypothetical protein